MRTIRQQISVSNAAQLTEIAQVKCGWITQVRWSPDGRTLAIAGADGVRLYAGSFGGQAKHVLGGHGGHVKGAAFRADGKVLATVASDTTIKLWDTSDLDGEVREIKTLKGHTDSIDAVAFHPKKNLLATASADATVHLWDVESGTQQAILEGHEKEVTSVAFAQDGNLLVSGSWDNTIRLWDVSAETGGAVFGTHSGWVRELCVNYPGTMIASASKDMSVGLWDALSGESYATVNAHYNGADTVSFSPDGMLLASGGRDNVVRLWSVHEVLRLGNANPDAALATLQGHTKPVMNVEFNPAGTLLASGGGDNVVRLWAVG